MKTILIILLPLFWLTAQPLPAQPVAPKCAIYSSMNTACSCKKSLAEDVMSTGIIRGDTTFAMTIHPPIPANQVVLLIHGVPADYGTVAVIEIGGGASTTDFYSATPKWPVINYGRFDPSSGFIDLSEKQPDKQLLLVGTTDRLVSSLLISIAMFASEAKAPIHYSLLKVAHKKEKPKKESAYLYPNPTSNSTSLVFSSLTTSNINIAIYGLEGKCIDKFVVKAVKGLNSFELNTATYPSGIYTISIQKKGLNMTTVRLVKH